MVGIDEARKLAITAMVDIRHGGDPTAEKRAERVAFLPPVHGSTVRERWYQWELYRDRSWSQKHAMEVGRIAKHDIFPVLGDRVLSETTRADWGALVVAKQAAGAPVMATLLYRIISGFLNYAEASGWIEHAPVPRGRAARAVIRDRQANRTDPHHAARVVRQRRQAKLDRQKQSSG
jgi:hypothetical protein